jgi:hypothetical protein
MIITTANAAVAMRYLLMMYRFIGEDLFAYKALATAWSILVFQFLVPMKANSDESAMNRQ